MVAVRFAELRVSGNRACFFAPGGRLYVRTWRLCTRGESDRRPPDDLSRTERLTGGRLQICPVFHWLNPTYPTFPTFLGRNRKYSGNLGWPEACDRDRGDGVVAKKDGNVGQVGFEQWIQYFKPPAGEGRLATWDGKGRCCRTNTVLSPVGSHP